MKKEILIAIPGMYMGGTEKVLINMLENIDYERVNVDLLLLDDNGILMKDLPSEINILKLPLSVDDQKLILTRKKDYIINLLKNKQLFKSFKSLFKFFLKDELYHLETIYEKLGIIEKKYDVSISYQFHNTFLTKYVANKINSKHKVAWVHNDLKTTKYNYKYTYSYIDKYDELFGVSNTILDEIKKSYADNNIKSSVFYNFIDVEKIKNLSKEDVKNNIFDETVVNILSIGRLNKQKGFDMAVEVARKLVKRNYKFKWFIIGEGEEKNKLIKKINKYKLENNVILLGLKSNPYKYIKRTDLYVQPSRHEGYSTTTNEARVLEKVIITTDVSGAREQFVNNINGLIVKKKSKSIYDGIITLINNEELCDVFKLNLQEIDFNKDSTLKLETLFFRNED